MNRQGSILLALLVLTLGACAPAPTPQTPSVTPTVLTARKGGTLRLALASDPVFNPVIARDPVSVIINKLVFAGLLRFDKNTMEPTSDLAEKWDVTEDGLSWTFRLRQGVKWHDGTPLTAEDVQFTYQSVLDPKVNSGLRGRFTNVVKVDVVDSATVRFTMKSPQAILPVDLADSQGILPKHLLDGKDISNYNEFNKKNPIGTGPYKLKEVVPGDHYTLVANEDYYGGRPNIDTVIWKIIPDTNVQVAQLKTGELDMTVVPTAAMEGLRNDPSLFVDYLTKIRYYAFIPNLRQPRFKDPRVILALTYGLDRGGIIKAVSGGDWEIATTLIHPAIKWAHDFSIQPISYDPDKAKTLLAEAGWKSTDKDGILQKDGEPFKFTIVVDTAPDRKQAAEIAQQNYRKLGLDASLEVMEWGTLVSSRYLPRKFDVVGPIETRSPPDADDSFHYMCDVGGNASGWCNLEADKLLKQGMAEMNHDKRQAIYYRWQKISTLEDPPVIPLAYAGEIRVRRSTLQGVPTTPPSLLDYSYSFYYLKDWWLKQ